MVKVRGSILLLSRNRGGGVLVEYMSLRRGGRKCLSDAWV